MKRTQKKGKKRDKYVQLCTKYTAWVCGFVCMSMINHIAINDSVFDFQWESLKMHRNSNVCVHSCARK